MSSTLILCTDQKSIIETLNVGMSIKLDNNPDLYLINESNESIKIKEIREINSQVIYPPSKEKFKTFILYNFEKATIPAQNAFLKSLEEHPSYIQFVLQCNTLNGILETIKSRCDIKKCDENKNISFEEELETTEKLSKVWNVISNGSYADIIEVCGQYKDRGEAKDLINSLTKFLHQKNQENPSLQITNGLTDLSICQSQLKQNSNVLLTLENHFFAIKSRF
jgi:DNA polymerase-3 subunit delta'